MSITYLINTTMVRDQMIRLSAPMVSSSDGGLKKMDENVYSGLVPISLTRPRTHATVPARDSGRERCSLGDAVPAAGHDWP